MGKLFFIMFTEEKRMSARVRFIDGEEPDAQLELEPELANRLFQVSLWIQNYLVRTYAVPTFWKLQNAVVGIWILRIPPLVFGPLGSGSIS
jgi:hypothetical protein